MHQTTNVNLDKTHSEVIIEESLEELKIQLDNSYSNNFKYKLTFTASHLAGRFLQNLYIERPGLIILFKQNLNNSFN